MKEGGKGAMQVSTVWSKGSVPGRGNSKNEGPEVATCRLCLGNSEDTCAVGAEQATGRRRGRRWWGGLRAAGNELDA